MAVKPTVFFVHATNLNYSLGPAVGLVTKTAVPTPADGFIPGTGVSAEQVNGLMNALGDWTVWLDAGSNAAGLDAHLIETDATGAAAVASATLGGTASAAVPLVIGENPANFTSALILNTLAGGVALDVRGNSATTWAGIFTQVVVGGTALKVEHVGAGAGLGLTVEALNASGVGVAVVAGSQAGVFTSLTDGDGVTATGALNGHGVDATAGSNGSAFRGIGQLTSNFPAIQALGGGVAGVQVRGTVWLQPTPSAPTTPIDGDLWRIPAVGLIRGGLEMHDTQGGVQRAHTTRGGFGYGYTESLGDTTENTGVAALKANLILDPTAAPGPPDGDYIVEFSALVRLGAAAALSTRAIVSFTSPAGTSTVQIDFAAVSINKPVTFFLRSPLLGPASNTYTMTIATSAVGEDVIMSEAKILARGAYE